jgi:hypothetical protein
VQAGGVPDVAALVTLPVRDRQVPEPQCPVVDVEHPVEPLGVDRGTVPDDLDLGRGVEVAGGGEILANAGELEPVGDARGEMDAAPKRNKPIKGDG